MNVPDHIAAELMKQAPDVQSYHNTLHDVSVLMQRVANAKKQADEARRQYDALNQAHSEELTKFRNTCPHQVTTFHYDSVDSSDNYEQCSICGATARRLKPKGKV